MIKRTLASLVLASTVLLGIALAPLPSYGQIQVVRPNAFTNIVVPTKAQGDIRQTIINLLNVVLGFLGLIAVIIIIAAGFMWMTAGGNEKRLETARKLLIQGFIGLVLILSAWAIAWFVINTLGPQFE